MERERDHKLASARTKGKIHGAAEFEHRNFVLAIRRDGKKQCRQALFTKPVRFSRFSNGRWETIKFYD